MKLLAKRITDTSILNEDVVKMSGNGKGWIEGK